MIPKKIGDMKLLESLDFSRNQLSCEIRSSISSLTFLSYLNLSFNNLSGRIPTSTQLQSFNASCFIGNKLCGPPISKNYNVNGVTPDNRYEEGKGDRPEVDWFYLCMALGFAAACTDYVLLLDSVVKYQRYKWNYLDIASKFEYPK
ncbi:hypothetical protein RJ640_002293 [Escallonia rubra]|uniref:Uncharacterized protein n=1 Tax=Escallonia rubra TaxID=112253 RepID=A0AA88RSJ3_9ASTE|nr:hypothetical protein RJ640_002293 [Escallonia rubra]